MQRNKLLAICIIALTVVVMLIILSGTATADEEITITPSAQPSPESEIVHELTEEERMQISIDLIKTNLKQTDIDMLARLIYGEARGITSDMEKAAVVWCVLNRAENWDKTIEEIVKAPNQFHGYWAGKITEEFQELAEDVLIRWELEKIGYEDVGRVLPKEYMFFFGDGKHNHFQTAYQSKQYWDWSLPDPYVEK